MPWVVLGDFNAIRTPNEKAGGGRLGIGLLTWMISIIAYTLRLMILDIEAATTLGLIGKRKRFRLRQKNIQEQNQ